jgi:tricorn protease
MPSLIPAVAALFLASSPLPFPRHPAPSPDGKLIAFGYQGDLFVVAAAGGAATRLTVHPAYEKQPVWSPDGRTIAFTSDRHGNDDVFLLPMTGGEPKRLTFHSGGDVACDFTPNGRFVIFTSRRDHVEQRFPVLYQVSVEGGTPRVFVPAGGGPGAVSPDGKNVAYMRGGGPWWRKGYRGSAANDLWLFDLEARRSTPLTSRRGNDGWPMWSPDGRTLYFTSDEDGTANVWAKAIEWGATRQLTRFRGDGVRFPAISRDGRLIAFERGDAIWTLETRGGDPAPLAIEAPRDLKENLVERRTFTDGADEMAVSPDEKEIAFVVRGEIYVVRNDDEGGRANPVTDDPARDRSIDWSPDGERLVFVSDRSGNREIYEVQSADEAEKRLGKTLRLETRALTETPENESSPRFSPDGTRLAFVRGLGDLVVAEGGGGEDRTIVRGFNPPQFAWSPDSKWIAYSQADDEFNHDVWIVSAAGGEPYNVTRHPDNDMDPVWSPDGRKLAFISRRGIVGETDVYFVWLSRADDEKTREDLRDEEEKRGGRMGAKPEKGDGDDGEEAAKDRKDAQPATVQIDFDRLHDRIRRVTSLPGNEDQVTISPDGKTFAFVASSEGKRELHAIRWDGAELKVLTKGGASPTSPRFTKDGKRITYLKTGGVLASIGVGGDSPKTVPFRARFTLNKPAERRQMFEECWQTLRDRFYDPDFHGADWQALRAKYLPLALSAADRNDFDDAVRRLLGELNASHLGISPPVSRGEGVTRTGSLGVIFDDGFDGPGLRIAEVLEGGPADRVASRLEPGEVVLSIGGSPIGKATDVSELLDDAAEERILVRVRGTYGAERDVVVRPISLEAHQDLLYERWVKSRRETVHRLGGGALGYVHVRAMGQPSLERFERELYHEANGKEGLVVDVRNNGGGWTTDMMLAMLSVREHAATVPRGGGRAYPQDRRPLYAWTKPIVVLCNESSYSNAEIFSWSIQTLGRGTVVGKQTYGAVISTDSIRLIDGSTFRVPFRGWFVAGSGLNMENNGCLPDVEVDNPPDEDFTGTDRQLEKAVAILKGQIQK